MRRAPRVLRVLATVPVALVLAGVLTAGCSSNDDAGPAPTPTASPGFKIVSGSGVSLQVPQDWVSDPTGASRHEDLSYVAPTSGDGPPAQGVSVTISKTPAKNVEDAADAQNAITLNSFKDARVADKTKVTVPGIGDAVRSHITVGSGDTAASTYDLVALEPNGTQLFVRVATRKPAQDDALADAILGSVTVTGATKA